MTPPRTLDVDLDLADAGPTLILATFTEWDDVTAVYTATIHPAIAADTRQATLLLPAGMPRTRVRFTIDRRPRR